MPKGSKPSFYAVHIGHKPGIYSSWAECEQQIKGYPKAAYKKFPTETEATRFVEVGFAGNNDPVAPPGNTVPSAGKPAPAGTVAVEQSAKEDVEDESGWDVVYTNGACPENGKPGAVAGVGVWWGGNDPRNMAERCPGDQTNNRAELIAVIRVLEMTQQDAKPLLIKTNSSYSISCVRDWIPSWRQRGWKKADGKDVKNKPVIVYLSALLEQRRRRGQTVRLQDARGPAEMSGKEGADKLAAVGVSMPEIPERDWTSAEVEISKEFDKDATWEFEVDEDDA